MASLLICKGNSPENFSKAWSIILGVEFDGDTRAFFDRFKFKKSISSLNEFLISTLERDGVIEPEDKKSGSKKNAMT